VGSTGLATRVGPAAAEELRQEHFRLLREAVEASGGHEVKNVGDGLMVVLQSSSSAVECAVGMQQRLDRRNRRADEQMMVRIGISAGEADHEDDDYFGPPVVEASRLCNAAAGGQILCGELVRMMAREGREFRSAGKLTLKGLPEPFPAFEVIWEPAAAEFGTIPLPPRLREVPPVGYVGRRAEREGLAYLLDEAREGARRIAFISGEPGIGKTRLASHAAVEAHGDGANVLYGRCNEELTAPYGPWVQALGYYVSESSEDVLREHVERHGSHLMRLVPELDHRLPDVAPPPEGDPETDRYLLFGAVAGMLEEASSAVPLMLILDDLHWADKPSLVLLRHLVTGGGEMRLLLLGTYRESDLARGHPLGELLADLHSEPGVSRVPLTGIEPEDVVSIMEAAAGHEMDETGQRLAQAITRETEGNPFYVGELLRHLVESGALVQQPDGRFRLEGRIADLGLPQSVREVVGRRVARLSEPAQRVLGVAAVIGRDFDVDLLSRIVDAGEDELLDMLDEAVAASVVNESGDHVGHFGFAHALINHTLYEDLGATRRARLHRRIAEALEEVCGPDPGPRVGELAHHWIRATVPSESAKALDYAGRAGARALAELAPDDALRWFDQALELQAEQSDADTAVRCKLLIGRGQAQRLTGEGDFRDTLLDASRLARDLGDPELLARACLENTRGQASQHGEVDAERVDLLETAIELAGREDEARRARLLALLALELNWDPDSERIDRLAEEALELARRSGDDRTLATVLYYCGLATQGAANARERHPLMTELIDVAGRTDDAVLLFCAANLESIFAGEVGDFAAVDGALARLEALANQVGQPSFKWADLFYRGARERIAGNLDEAERLATEAAAMDEPDAFMVFAAQIAGIRWEQGRAEELRDLMEQAIDNFPGISGFRAGLAIFDALLDRFDDARRMLDAELERGLDQIPRDQSELASLVIWSDVAFETRARDVAAELYDRLSPSRGLVMWNGAIAYNSVDHYLAGLCSLLGRYDEAVELFESAVELQKRIPAPIWLARTRHWYGRTLLDRDAPGDPEHGREMLNEAIELATTHGAAHVERRAREAIEAPSARRSEGFAEPSTSQASIDAPHL